MRITSKGTVVYSPAEKAKREERRARSVNWQPYRRTYRLRSFRRGGYQFSVNLRYDLLECSSAARVRAHSWRSTVLADMWVRRYGEYPPDVLAIEPSPPCDPAWSQMWAQENDNVARRYRYAADHAEAIR